MTLAELAPQSLRFNTSLTIPAAELVFVEKSLPHCFGINLLGINHLLIAKRQYCVLQVAYRESNDLCRLGELVGAGMEKGGQLS